MTNSKLLTLLNQSKTKGMPFEPKYRLESAGNICHPAVIREEYCESHKFNY